MVLVSASGALAPGPLFFYAAVEGTKTGLRGGLAASAGHMAVEFPFVLALAAGLQAVLGEPGARFWISMVGGGVLIVFGGLQLLVALRAKIEAEPSRRLLGGAVVMGALFTGLNPFFIVWWLTVGSKLVLDALVLASILGVLVMYAAHVWMDYAFLGLAAQLSKKGIDLVGMRGYRFLLGIFAALLVYFGVSFVSSALQFGT